MCVRRGVKIRETRCKNYSLFVAVVSFAFTLSTSFAASLPPRSQGETLYIPVYSQVLHGNVNWTKKAEEKPLSAMLSIRNTDPKLSIKVLSIKYFDTDGHFVRDYPAGVKELGPLATVDVFIEHKDIEGGTGANFIVEWRAEQAVNAPIVEAVHTFFQGPSAMVFVSPAQALQVGQ